MKILFAIISAIIITACGNNDLIYGIDIAKITDEGDKTIEKYSNVADGDKMAILACVFLPLAFIEEVAFSSDNKSLEDLSKFSKDDIHPVRLSLNGNVLSFFPDDVNKINDSVKKDLPTIMEYEKIDNIDFLVFKVKPVTCRLPLKKLN